MQAAELRIAIRQKPDSRFAHNALAAALREIGHLDAAEAEFQEALNIDPRSVYALDGLTKILIEQKRYSAAIQYLRDALRDDGLRLKLALAYSKGGSEDEAIDILAHFNLAGLYERRRRFREAAGEYQDVLRLDVSNDAARMALVRSLTVLMQYSEAQPLIEDVILEPDNADALYALGQNYLQHGYLAAPSRVGNRCWRSIPSVLKRSTTYPAL